MIFSIIFSRFFGDVSKLPFNFYGFTTSKYLQIWTPLHFEVSLTKKTFKQKPSQILSNPPWLKAKSVALPPPPGKWGIPSAHGGEVYPGDQWWNQWVSTVDFNLRDKIGSLWCFGPLFFVSHRAWCLESLTTGRAKINFMLGHVWSHANKIQKRSSCLRSGVCVKCQK